MQLETRIDTLAHSTKINSMLYLLYRTALKKKFTKG